MMLIDAPTLLLAAQVLVLALLTSDDPRVRRAIMFMHTFLFVRCLWWRVFQKLPRFEIMSLPAIVTYVFCAFEVFLTLFTIKTQKQLIPHRQCSRQADQEAGWWADSVPRVAVLIATYFEIFRTHDYFKPARAWTFLGALQPLARSRCGR